MSGSILQKILDYYNEHTILYPTSKNNPFSIPVRTQSDNDLTFLFWQYIKVTKTFPIQYITNKIFSFNGLLYECSSKFQWTVSHALINTNQTSYLTEVFRLLSFQISNYLSTHNTNVFVLYKARKNYDNLLAIEKISVMGAVI
jgi:hypothetical protein